MIITNYFNKFLLNLKLIISISAYFKIILYLSFVNVNYIFSSITYEFDNFNLSTDLSNGNINSISESCACNLKQNTCDAYCCCDETCLDISGGTDAWKEKGECWTNNKKIHRYPDCFNKEISSHINDLFSPIRLITQNYKKGLCVVIDNANLNNTLNIERYRSFNDKTISSNYDDLIKYFGKEVTTDTNNINIVDTSEEFYSYLSNILNEDKTLNKMIPSYYIYENNIDNEKILSIDDNNDNNINNKNSVLDNFKGYNVNNQVIFRVKESDSIMSYKYLTLPIVDNLGRCLINSNSYTHVKYLNSDKVFCGNKLILNNDYCSNFNKLSLGQINKQFIDLNFDNNNKQDIVNILASYNIDESSIKFSSNITTTISYVRYSTYQYNIESKDIYSISSFTEYSKDNIDIRANNNLCKCEGVLSEVRYTFRMDRTDILALEINYYVQTVEGLCNTEYYKSVYYSYEFKQYDINYTYTLSGNPGYYNNAPLLTGKVDDIIQFNEASNVESKLQYIIQYKEPRKIYGISLTDFYHLYQTNEITTNNQQFSKVFEHTKAGTCLYKTDTLINNESYINNNFVENNIDFNYYTDPLLNGNLNFGVNLSWGCSENINSLEDLKVMCINQLWKEKLIYNIVNDIQYVGQFGNANRHFISDWIKSDEINLNDYQSVWDDQTNRCLVPSIINIDVLYSDFGLYNNTQHGILKISKRIESTYWYGDKGLLNTENIEDKDILNNIDVNNYIDAGNLKDKSTLDSNLSDKNFVLTNNYLNSVDIISEKGIYSLYDNEINIILQNKSNLKKQKNRVYNTYININYIKIPVSSVWYFASGPSIKPPKNIMYPFRIGKTQYWHKDSTSYIKLNLNILLVFILILIVI